MASRTNVPLSILDLAIVGKGESVREALDATVAVAQLAEERGYRRIWYAEHHNMSSIASSATSVLIAHVASQTTSIRLGAGGIMLPNHAPLLIAEQFGTLETLHPGRIDLGLGRAPGSDQATMRAMRRDPMASDSFPQDVVELQGYLSGQTMISGVHATPGKGTCIPLYILGSSLFGASLAAALGLPYAFASHFSPGALQDAVARYRRDFQPSAQLDQPYVIAGVNVTTAATDAEAAEMHRMVSRFRVSRFLGGEREFSDAEADSILASPQGRQIAQMMHYTAVGAPDTVKEYLDDFAIHADADELMVVHSAPTVQARLRSVDLVADVSNLSPV